MATHQRSSRRATFVVGVVTALVAVLALIAADGPAMGAAHDRAHEDDVEIVAAPRTNDSAAIGTKIRADRLDFALLGAAVAAIAIAAPITRTFPRRTSDEPFSRPAPPGGGIGLRAPPASI